MISDTQTTVFFRNDDVNRAEPGLAEITELLVAEGVPVSHAVEPANLTDEVRDWLLGRGPEVEIIQHGYAHARHDRGEFGGARSAEDQRRDLVAGLDIMREAFGNRFFPAMSFPFGLYNGHSIPILDDLGYAVVSCHCRHQLSRQVFYGLGRMLGRGRWLGRHVSHHLRAYPGTRVREVSVSVSPIAAYHHDAGPTACSFYGEEELLSVFAACRRQSPVVGVVLHHRFHASDEGLGRLQAFIRALKNRRGMTFATLADIDRRLGSRTSGP